MIEYDEPFDTLLENLQALDEPLRAALIYRLSDPTAEELRAFEDVWADTPVERRRLLLTRLFELSEVNFEVDFTDVAHLALRDEDDEVRKLGIKALWENQEPATMRQIVRMLRQDAATEVRAAAAQALGRFVLAGELGEFSEAAAQEAEASLLEAWFELEESPEVRRRALESIAYSEREEVPNLIEEALNNPNVQMQASALFAMGRSSDERWADPVLAALYHPEPELRFEAARAAGELFLSTAVHRLAEMLTEEDREIQQAAIWSLGEIGGDDAQRALLTFAEDDNLDDVTLDILEDALNTAALSTGEFVTYIINTEDDHEAIEGFDGMDLEESDFDLLSDLGEADE